MNKKRLLAVAEAITQAHVLQGDARGMGFNMNHFCTAYPGMDFNSQECGSVGCIAGWALSMFTQKQPSQFTFDEAGRELGLNSVTADMLFFGRGCELELFEIHPYHAAAVIRHLVETGEVEWDIDYPGRVEWEGGLQP